MFDQHQNDFEILGIAPRFPIDRSELDRAYRDLQMKFHPDHFVLEEAHVQQKATLYASEINDAYRRLRSPMGCAEAYFLVRFDHELLEKVTGDIAFLSYMLELSEQIEKGVGTNDIGTLNSISDVIDKKIKEVRSAVTDGFTDDDAIRTATAIAHWKYLEKSHEHLAEQSEVLIAS